MKRRAIYLDANNDIYSTLGKLERVDAEEIILVIPKSSVLFHSSINFKILRAEMERRHKLLAVVTVDPKGQQLAQRVGIPTYKDLELTEEVAEAPVSPLPPPTAAMSKSSSELRIKYKRRLPISHSFSHPPAAIIKTTPAEATSKSSLAFHRAWKLKRDWPRNFILLGWILGSVVVLGLVIYLAVPRATVDLEIRSEPFTHQFKLVLADVNDKEAAGQNVFQGRFVEVEKKMTQTFPSTGTKNNGNKAYGTITVYNYTRGARPIGLKAQTRFQSPDGRIFRSQSELLIASATLGSSGKLVPGRANVKVEADEGGISGNLNAGTKLTIPGLGAEGVDMVYGQNEASLAGGTDAETKMITAEDIKAAQDSISKNVFVDAEAELQNQVGKKEELIDNLIQNDVINVVPSSPAGTARDNFDLDIQVRSWTLLPLKGKLAEIMQNTITAVVPSDRSLTPQTLQGMRPSLDNADYSTHIIDFTVAVDGLVAPKISAADISGSLANRSLKSVETLFNSIPDIISQKVTLWPFWVKKMPLLESNIKINFSYINQ